MRYFHANLHSLPLLAQRLPTPQVAGQTALPGPIFWVTLAMKTSRS